MDDTGTSETATSETVWPGAEPNSDDLLKLARKGKDCWNHWRKAHPNVRVKFAGVDFTTVENKDIDFSGFEFGDGARFLGAKFGNAARFLGAKFGNEAQFDDATFGNWAGFACATFGDRARFNGVKFSDHARFDGATFGDWAQFVGATFGDRARFDGSRGDRKESLIRMIIEAFPEPVNEQDLQASESGHHNPDSFGSMDFTRAHFKGLAFFCDRNFAETAIFAHARFGEPPDLTGTEGWDNLDWTNARFGFAGSILTLITRSWTTQAVTVVRLRRLCKIAAEIHDQDAERDLFILKRKAERGTLWRQWWERKRDLGQFVSALGATGLLFFYSLLSDCGRSIWRPITGLGAVNIGAYSAFESLAGANAGNFNALLTFTLSNVVPFFGFSRPAANGAAKELFEASVLPAGVQALGVGQGLLNAVLLFLLLLALRNHFRVR